MDGNEDKNKKLKEERGVTFEQVMTILVEGRALDIVQHTHRPNQMMYIVEIENYVYIVPFFEDEEIIFLKTIISDRKATKKYLQI